MAIEFITAVWKMSPYQAEKLLVHLALADWSNDEGTVWPSYQEIADKARITKPGAIKIIQKMIEDGELERLEAGNGRGHKSSYRMAAHYVEAVQNIRSEWASKRKEKSKPRLPLAEPERVNEKHQKVNPVDPFKGKPDLPFSEERVNENAIKGKREVAHIRTNRHEPSEEGNSPAIDDLGSALENMYPGYATDFRTMRSLADLVIRLKASTVDVLRFGDWLKAAHPKKANTIFAFRDLFHESLQTAPLPVVEHFCGNCNRGWLPSANGQDGARRCPCVSRRSTERRQEVSA